MYIFLWIYKLQTGHMYFLIPIQIESNWNYTYCENSILSAIKKDNKYFIEVAIWEHLHQKWTCLNNINWNKNPY